MHHGILKLAVDAITIKLFLFGRSKKLGAATDINQRNSINMLAVEALAPYGRWTKATMALLMQDKRVIFFTLRDINYLFPVSANK